LCATSQWGVPERLAHWVSLVHWTQALSLHTRLPAQLVVVRQATHVFAGPQ
jgi:hypothetical protein